MLALYVSASSLKTRFHAAMKRFAGSESGATAIEYGLIASLISIAILGILGTVGQDLVGKFQQIATALQ